MNNELIMIIGAGVFQIPAIKAAQETGCKVLAVDADPQAPGVQIADFFESLLRFFNTPGRIGILPSCLDRV